MRSIDTRTIGGTRETEVNELTVIPCRLPFNAEVTIVTPVAHWRIASRSISESIFSFVGKFTFTPEINIRKEASFVLTDMIILSERSDVKIRFFEKLCEKPQEFPNTPIFGLTGIPEDPEEHIHLA